MRRKFAISIVMFLIVVFAKVNWKDFRTDTEHALQTLSFSKQIQLDPYARSLGGQLRTPFHNDEIVNGDMHVAGSIRRYQALRSQFVWITVEYKGEKASNLPTTYHYYVPMQKGDFRHQVRLSCGPGRYRITMHLSSDEKKDVYYPFTSFNVLNTSTKFTRDICLSTLAQDRGLRFDRSLTGYQVASESIRVRGEIADHHLTKSILVQVQKGKEIWRKVVSCRDGRFDERIPLLFGEGIHDIQVMVPDGKQSGYYLEGATFFVHNASNLKWNPIRYTSLCQERGIRLTHPISGGSHTGLMYRISGSIDPKARYAKETDHMIVHIIKEKDEATYFLPVVNGCFDDVIWLRFGSGTYTVEVMVAEVTSEQRDFFKFYSVATFEIESNGVGDLRNLLPSRGINSDDSKIVHLASQLTADKRTETEKAKAIYTYVAKNMNYDVHKSRSNTFSWKDSALKALQTKQGVCQDYVFLSLALLRAAGIPSRFVKGTTPGGASHAWIESWLDDRWITMDPTWGSGVISGGGFVRRFDSFYFDPPTRDFQNTHKRTGVIY